MDLLEYTREIYVTFGYDVMQTIDKVLEVLIDTDTIFTAGNGGSSSSASHFTQDLMKTCYRKSYCLSDNIAYILATANDLDFERIYATNLYLNGKKGDTLFCISGSGNSKNLIEAVWAAKRIKMKTISLVGFDGGRLKDICDLSIHPTLFDMRRAESAHSIILHYIIDRLEGIKK